MGRLADQFAAAQARGTALMPMTVTRGGVTETVGDVRRDVDDCGFPKPAKPAKPKARSAMPRGTYDLTCADCGRTFEAPVLNRPPLRCPECKRAHKNDLEITNRLRKKALRRCPME